MGPPFFLMIEVKCDAKIVYSRESTRCGTFLIRVSENFTDARIRTNISRIRTDFEGNTVDLNQKSMFSVLA